MTTDLDRAHPCHENPARYRAGNGGEWTFATDSLRELGRYVAGRWDERRAQVLCTDGLYHTYTYYDALADGIA